MEAATPRTRTSNRPGHSVEVEDLTDYCWRPKCRKEFRRTVGPGRPQGYCSEICRRTAEKELRQARSRLAHFEDLVRKLRIDVAAFGKHEDDEAGYELASASFEARQTAENAVRRAAGALAFANPDEPAARELQMFYEAVAPVILSDSMAV
jgi:hypothetical protein